MKKVYTEDQAKSINERMNNKRAIANKSKRDRKLAIEQHQEDRRLKESLDLDIL